MREKDLPFLRCPTQERLEPTQIYDVGLGNTFQIIDTPLRAHYYAVTGAKLDSTCPGLAPFEVTSCGASICISRWPRDQRHHVSTERGTAKANHRRDE